MQGQVAVQVRHGVRAARQGDIFIVVSTWGPKRRPHTEYRRIVATAGDIDGTYSDHDSFEDAMAS